MTSSVTTGESQFLSLAQFAKRLGVHKHTVRGWIAEGKIKACRPGGTLFRIPASELARLERGEASR